MEGNHLKPKYEPKVSYGFVINITTVSDIDRLDGLEQEIATFSR